MRISTNLRALCCQSGLADMNATPMTAPAITLSASPLNAVAGAEASRAAIRAGKRYGKQKHEIGDTMGTSYALMDLTVYGRREGWEDSPAGWPADGPGPPAVPAPAGGRAHAVRRPVGHRHG